MAWLVGGYSGCRAVIRRTALLASELRVGQPACASGDDEGPAGAWESRLRVPNGYQSCCESEGGLEMQISSVQGKAPPTLASTVPAKGPDGETRQQQAWARYQA